MAGLVSCNFSADNRQVNADSLRADSLWKVAIADSINRARSIPAGHDGTGLDTVSNDIEAITRGMTEGLNKVQEGLNKVRKITEVSSQTSKAINDGIKKTKDAVNKTVEEAKKTIKGE